MPYENKQTGKSAPWNKTKSAQENSNQYGNERSVQYETVGDVLELRECIGERETNNFFELAEKVGKTDTSEFRLLTIGKYYIDRAGKKHFKNSISVRLDMNMEQKEAIVNKIAAVLGLIQEA